MYKPGDIVNGYILGEDNKWSPVADQPTVDKTTLVGLNAYQAAQKAFSAGYSPHFYDGDTGGEYRASSPPSSFIVAREEYEDKKVRLYSPSTTAMNTNGNEEMVIQQEQSFSDIREQQLSSSYNDNNVGTPQVYGYTPPSSLPLYAQPNSVSYSPPKIKTSYGVTNMWLWLIVFVIPTLGFILMYVNTYVIYFPLWTITAPLCAFFAYQDCKETDGGLLWLLAFFLPPAYLIVRRIQTGENQLPFLVATAIVIFGAIIVTMTAPSL